MNVNRLINLTEHNGKRQKISQVKHNTYNTAELKRKAESSYFPRLFSQNLKAEHNKIQGNQC
jgi:hypothetical protein